MWRPTITAAQTFINANAVLAAYDRGEFCFDGAGGGGPGLTQTYGEAIIPEMYAKRVYSPFFSVVQFTTPIYNRRLDQALILLKK